jgi:hypothetical protein
LFFSPYLNFSAQNALNPIPVINIIQPTAFPAKRSTPLISIAAAGPVPAFKDPIFIITPIC